MKSSALLPALLLPVLFCVGSAIAAPIAAPSKVSAVTVYTDRAFVTRSASVDLSPSGPLEVTFEKLPAYLDAQSITVAGHGTAHATILEVTARDVFTEFTPDERVKALEDTAHTLAKQQRGLDDRMLLLKAQEASLDHIENAATATTTANKDPAPRLTIEESLKLLTFLTDQRSKLLAERQTLDAQLEELAAKQAAVKNELAQLPKDTERRSKTITVRLSSADAGQLQLDVTYALLGAGWIPVYDARAHSNDPTVELSYFGVVRQSTGEDWKDVALTLSTARPSLGGSAPELSTWTVSAVRPGRPSPAQTLLGPTTGAMVYGAKNGGAAFEGVGELAPREASHGFSPTQVAADMAVATVETAATGASFKIATLATVPSDSSPQKIPIATV